MCSDVLSQLQIFSHKGIWAKTLSLYTIALQSKISAVYFLLHEKIYPK